MAIRSGRFIGDANQALGTNPINKGLRIIDGHGGTYRIFNSGYSDFDIKIKGQSVINLPTDCSVDIRPGNGDVVIRKSNSGNAIVEGIYDFLSEHSSIKSGRFSKLTSKLNVVNDVNAKVVPTIYRVMNSGDETFQVNRRKNNKSKLVTQLRSKMSIDVELDGDGLEIEPTKASDGIYFHLDQIADVKSGRFKLDPTISGHPKPNTSHIIIDTKPNSKNDAFYRIFNSGEHSFNVTGINQPILIKKGMSYDFKIGKAKAVIAVQGLNANDAIEGSFDFVEPHAD